VYLVLSVYITAKIKLLRKKGVYLVLSVYITAKIKLLRKPIALSTFSNYPAKVSFEILSSQAI